MDRMPKSATSRIKIFWNIWYNLATFFIKIQCGKKRTKNEIDSITTQRRKYVNIIHRENDALYLYALRASPICVKQGDKSKHRTLIRHKRLQNVSEEKQGRRRQTAEKRYDVKETSVHDIFALQAEQIKKLHDGIGDGPNAQKRHIAHRNLLEYLIQFSLIFYQNAMR